MDAETFGLTVGVAVLHFVCHHRSDDYKRFGTALWSHMAGGTLPSGPVCQYTSSKQLDSQNNNVQKCIIIAVNRRVAPVSPDVGSGAVR